MSIVGSLSVCAFVAVRERDAAKAFYGGVLGLALKSEDPYGIVFALRGADLRVTPLPDFAALPYTVLGWTVADVPATVQELGAGGIVFERYSFLEQDELGIWSNDGAQVAWFKDPDGNILSISSSQ